MVDRRDYEEFYVTLPDMKYYSLSLSFPQIHWYSCSSGHTINSALEEGVSGAAKNKYVRGAVKAGVSAACDSK